MLLSSPGTIKPTLQLPNIYELSQFQFEILKVACNGGSIVFAVLEPSDNDSTAKKEKLTDEVKQVKDLIKLQLLEDISNKFKDTIQMAKINNNRGVMIVAVTPVGIYCFRDINKRTVN